MKKLLVLAAFADADVVFGLSKHFVDQAERYATGNLRDVDFYRDQLKGHTEREYRPGQ